MTVERPTDGPEVQIGYETTDVAVRPVAIAAGSVFFATFIISILMAALLGYYVSQRSQESAGASPLAGAYGRQVPPAPRLQTDALADLGALRAQEETALSTYGWIDRNAGVAHIPIDRAIALVAERGLPVRAGAVRPEAAR